MASGGRKNESDTVMHGSGEGQDDEELNMSG